MAPGSVGAGGGGRGQGYSLMYGLYSDVLLNRVCFLTSLS